MLKQPNQDDTRQVELVSAQTLQLLLVSLEWDG